MKLIVISSSRSIENEAQIVTELFEAGLETFHLRKLKISTRRMQEFIKEIPSSYHSRIFLHSHHNLTYKFKLGGIHLTSTHKKKGRRNWLAIKLIKLRSPQIEITTSYKTIGHLLDEKDENLYSYVFLSPVFDNTSSKFQKGFTDNSLNSVLARTGYKVVARGGVDISSVEKAGKLGFDGLAFYSSIWKSKNPVEEFNKIVNTFEELKIPIE